MSLLDELKDDGPLFDFLVPIYCDIADLGGEKRRPQPVSSFSFAIYDVGAQNVVLFDRKEVKYAVDAAGEPLNVILMEFDEVLRERIPSSKKFCILAEHSQFYEGTFLRLVRQKEQEDRSGHLLSSYLLEYFDVHKIVLEHLRQHSSSPQALSPSLTDCLHLLSFPPSFSSPSIPYPSLYILVRITHYLVSQQFLFDTPLTATAELCSPVQGPIGSPPTTPSMTNCSVGPGLGPIGSPSPPSPFLSQSSPTFSPFFMEEDGVSGFSVSFNDTEKAKEEESSVLRLRGLPFRCTESDLMAFFAAYQVQAIILNKNKRGRATGDAYIKFRDKKERDSALVLDKEYIGRRYIEVFKSTEERFEYAKMMNGRKNFN